MALDRPFSDGRVQTANVAVSASTVSANKMGDFVLMLWANDLCVSDISNIDEIAETGVSDQRGRTKAAKLHTRGARRAKTCEGGWNDES